MNKFNLGKFNVSSESASSITGYTEFGFESSVKSVVVEKHIEVSQSNINYESIATAIAEKFGVTDETNIDFDTTLFGSVFVFSENGTSDVTFESAAIGSLLGEEYVELSGFVLLPGQEIEINLCDLTATVDGENAIHLLSNDGDFFELMPGLNDIEIQTNAGTYYQVDTFWKDRWL